MQLTTKQRAALATLKAARPFRITPARTFRRRGTWTPVEVSAHIATGLNTATLFNLAAAGLIACSRIYLRGHVTPDLTITPAGEAVSL